MSVSVGDPGSPTGSMARLATGRLSGAAGGFRADAAAATTPLQLVRSYQIPADDPAYTRLLNWSWTYDSAVSAAALASTGDQANSGQLLDQLAALQHTDGSIEVAFNLATGESSSVFRSGTSAWLGLAEATYDQAFSSSRYLGSERLSADYLLSLQGPTGLIRGGPDVTWTSTQHNLIAYVFLIRLGNELQAAGDLTSAAHYRSAAVTIANAIDANLLVSDGSSAHFLEGLNDPTQTLDVQALGAMFLQGTGQPTVAAQVLSYAQNTFAVSGHSVAASSDAATYNLAYSATGPFSGYMPYAGPGAPNILWAEGSGEMRLAEAALGQDTSTLDRSIADWAAITAGSGNAPLQADKTYNNGTGLEYHVWPASTTAAWTVLAKAAPAFFAAPLPPAATLVNQWTAVRGGNLITTHTNGQVEMTGAGERRVLAGPPAGTDYTVTSNATLASGAGYGVYVRATVDAGTKLTAYCIQLDHTYGTGQIVVREILNDAELGVPIAHINVPAGFTWYGVPHLLRVTVKGNTMNITLDGAQTLNVADLATASAFSVHYAYGAASTLTPPTAGGYGLRSWSDGVVSLQQMTVGSAN